MSSSFGSFSDRYSLRSLGTWVLVHWCSALLPPVDKNELDYYELLGLTDKSASLEDIRKAYKKKSLQLHPDKVTQRGGDVEKAQQDFILVQEAHTVLSDSTKRQRYHAVQCSPTRYRFVSSEAAAHPQQVYENLSRSSCAAKSRIVLLCAAFVGLLLLQPILIVVKLNQDNRSSGGALENTDWVVILIPLYLLQGCVVALLGALWIITPRANGKFMVFLTFFEHFLWLVGNFLVALRFDGTLTERYRMVFIPIHVALILRSFQALLTKRHARRRVSRMVTQSYLDHKILDGGRSYDELNEEERKELETQYVLVHVPPDFAVDVEVLPGLEEDDLEAMRVEASPEYEHAMIVSRESLKTFLFVWLILAPFVAMVVNKVDGRIDISWWIVFLPFWVYLGFGIVGSCFTCCFGTVTGQEVVLEPESGEEGDDGKEDEDDVRERDGEDGPVSPFAATEGRMHEFNASIPQGDDDAVTGETKSGTSQSSSVPLGDGGAVSAAATASRSNEETNEGGDDDNRSPGANDDDASVGSEAFRQWEQDTYRDWKAAQDEAEVSSREAQAKAQLNCCGLSWQLMFLCLIVGYLEKEYQRAPGEEGAYNAVWIIFPFLLVAGCLFSCCACFVYGAGLGPDPSSSLDDASGEEGVTHDGVDEENPPVGKPTSDAAVVSRDDEPEVAVAAVGEQDDDDLD